MKRLKTRKKMKCLAAMAIAGVLLSSTGATLYASAMGIDLNKFVGPDNLSYGGKFYSDYNSLEEVFEAAEELNGEVVAEGTVLMKNDGTLPLDPRYNAISVLGVRSGDIREGVDGTIEEPNAPASMATGLRNAGFKVNPTLEKWYASLPETQRLEMEEVGIANRGPQFSEAVKRSFRNYKDAAIVVIQRCDFKENVDGSVALTGHTTNSGENVEDMVNGPFAGNRANDSLRELQDEVKEGAELTDPYGWEHAHSAQSPAEEGEEANENGNVEVKHELQLTSSEIDLIEYAKANFDKVMVVFNSSHTFETYNLEKDPEINAMLWFGRPGIHESGVTAVGKIISGEITPSGGHSAEYVRDFTADPTWMNSVTGRQFRYGAYSEEVPGDFVYRYPDENGKYLTTAPGSTGIGGIRGIDYEEGIYLGYKYYETVYAEIAAGNLYVKDGEVVAQGTEGAETGEEVAKEWHDFNVVYPFGFGLSYTTFSFEMGGIYKDKALKNKIEGDIDASLFASSEGNPAEVKKLYLPVTVENIGSVEGKKTVQIYVTAPYKKGEIEKSFVKLVGFEKTNVLKPGQKETVVVEIDVQDVASFDYNDANKNGHSGWELDDGEYIFRAMENSSVYRSTAYDDAAFTLSADAIMELDSYSDNEVTPLFSDPDKIDYSIRTGKVGGGKFNESEEAGMTILSRADMYGTFPEPPTVADLTITQEAIDRQKQVLQMNSANNFNDFFGEELGAIDNENQPWYVEAVPENWTQSDGSDRIDGKAKVQLYQMAGVPLTGSIEIDGKEFTWDDFMNQLTYDEMKSLWGSSPAGIEAIGKQKDSNADRPLNLAQTFTWADAPLQAATWNKDLIRRLGEIVGEFGLQKGVTGTSGWWGPGANTNRSQFAGRTKEYYSQDAILAGYMAASSVSGAQSKGLNVYIKHCALYDQEDMNAGTTVWVDEQTMRENYLVSFKKTMQDGNAAGAMISCWRVGQEQIAHNYDFITTMMINEWGWSGEWVTDHTGGQNSPSWTNPLAAEGETKYNWPSGNFNSQEILLRNGGLTIMGSGAGKLNGVWDETLRDGKGGVKVTYGSGESAVTKESVEEYYYMRMMALKGLYKAANSKLVSNGVNTSAAIDQEIEMTQATAANASIALSEKDLNGGSASYSIVGELPEGLTLDAATGAITGTPTEICNREYTVNVVIDGWVKLSGKIALEVRSPWIKDLSKANVGEAFEGSVTMGITTSGTITYSVVNGQLPEGLTLDAATGNITGTPVTSGDYKFAVQASIEVNSGWNTSVTTYTSEEFVLSVNGGEEVPSFQVRINDDGMIQVTNDGGQTWIDVINKSELKGDPGQDGVTPTVSISEDGYWVINGEKTDVKAQGDKGDKGDKGDPGAAGQNGADGKDGTSGCGSSLSAFIPMTVGLAIIGGACVLRKKKD